MALLGRFYERFADHAVNAGKHIIYLITGEPVTDGPPPPPPRAPTPQPQPGAPLDALSLAGRPG